MRGPIIIFEAGQVFCEAFDDNEIRDLKQIIFDGEAQSKKYLWRSRSIFGSGISQKSFVSIKLIC